MPGKEPSSSLVEKAEASSKRQGNIKSAFSCPSAPAAPVTTYCPKTPSLSLFPTWKLKHSQEKQHLPGDCLPLNPPDSCNERRCRPENIPSASTSHNENNMETNLTQGKIQCEFATHERFPGPPHIVRRRTCWASGLEKEKPASLVTRQTGPSKSDEKEANESSGGGTTRRPVAVMRVSDPGPYRAPHPEGTKIGSLPKVPSEIEVLRSRLSRDEKVKHTTGLRSTLNPNEMNALLERLTLRTSDAVQSKKILEREIQKHKNRTRYLRCEEYKLMRELEDLRRKAKAAQQREQRHAEKQISGTESGKKDSELHFKELCTGFSNSVVYPSTAVSDGRKIPEVS
ncbi:hypothetical protein TGPRC2_301200 [Toxoplasma gondii TgCatPRC2]|uniref:Uncharacterized protein n=5 Tax=Toxoplasma gondii TaxID=5811 RepID=S7UGD5_TOXGG|nr:hypothetical protein TGME49_301200 [Toxoplasma gondii ME49]EPR57186.1 hypothetical protein TGGT1_301200 [Toxoplasma gondii GT1]KAF4645164.1 hypothetical protein TGRH88_009810 [Toxoplasma gondii]KYF38922.1 hypothetical protein TGARI_301200 [Toxoplasma gondii ARI]KYK63228.1 hypothetical protein TGPRC2_301200 [Toxoplasma gondii TgCatPRC2]EPT31331.1 hypothetical protein TGME49_301200 [Toxoplasma gondii ME49]|eukprot:XP_002371642.1 hypothetical protein TGME49_301200 [Toxoplasma gondii ME49]